MKKEKEKVLSFDETIKSLIGDYRRFMTCIGSNSNDKIVKPTVLTDLVWHTHMLTPEIYFNESKLLANGKFVRHYIDLKSLLIEKKGEFTVIREESIHTSMNWSHNGVSNSKFGKYRRISVVLGVFAATTVLLLLVAAFWTQGTNIVSDNSSSNSGAISRTKALNTDLDEISRLYNVTFESTWWSDDTFDYKQDSKQSKEKDNELETWHIVLIVVGSIVALVAICCCLACLCEDSTSSSRGSSTSNVRKSTPAKTTGGSTYASSSSARKPRPGAIATSSAAATVMSGIVDSHGYSGGGGGGGCGGGGGGCGGG